ncbi:MAG: S-layer homology domain-containing protein [Oscillospiraceae bacterium]|jgi:hypothetical protein|nr:S-layer homology domain-containing protein [Oscillospiraceae bacterium]
MHTQSGNTSKQRLHRLLSLLLAVVMVVGMFPAVVPSSRADSWATPYLDKMVGWGFMRADQAADHNRAMTRAEFMAVINRAYGYDQVGEIPFTDVRPSDWFYEDVCIAYNARYMAGTSETTASPNSTLTREQAVVILGHNMMLEEASGENLNFTDARSISDWSRGLVKTASDQYIINGYADGSFRPKSQVTRGEVAALVCNIIGTPIQEAGEHELGEVFGNVTITSAGVTLKNTTIAGDLYISGGVDLGNVELENVNVLGRIIIGGAGESEKGKASLILRNVQADEMLVDSLKDQYITMRVEGSTVIPEVTVKTPAYLEDNTPLDYGLKTITFDAEEESKLDLAGRIKEVVNLTPGSTIQVAKGTVEKMTVDEKARESQIVIDRGASVRELNLDTGTEVTGEGDIGSLNVNAPGSTTTMLPDKIYIRPGLTANIAGTVMDSTAAEEASRDPKILAGYPAAGDVAPTTVRVDVKTNKKGTVYWAITPLTDGSLSAEELINPPSYGSKAVQSGTISVTAADTLTSGNATGLVSDGTYYISAVLVDGQGKRSPVKVTAFTTPDNSVPAFNTGYPRMTQTKPDSSWVLVMPNKTCKLYYALYPAGAAAPTPDNLKSGSLSGNVGYGVMDVTKNVETSFQVNDRTLAEMKDYVLYLWLTDANGANSSAVVQLPFTTDDTTPPFFTTLPYVTQEGPNSVNLSYEVSENSTVYWAVVPYGTPYPRPETGTTTVDLSSEYAKIQVKSGMHALARGESRFTMGREGTMNITGLQPQTSYELYFVIQDEQGNFSVSVQHMTINTQDNEGPTVRQNFTRYNEIEIGEEKRQQPHSNTDIELIFSEGIQSNLEEHEVFLDLYNAVLAAQNETDREKARIALAKCLVGSIHLYYADTTPPEEVPYIIDGIKNEDGITSEWDKENDDWVLDYRYATVEINEDGETVITFPYNSKPELSATKLGSGVSYYFEVEEITDTSTAHNRMPKTKLDTFTTVFAQVYLSNPGLGAGELPFVREITNGTVTGLTSTPVNVDASFRMRPGSTASVEERISYDVLIWADTIMEYDLYYRVRSDRNADVTNQHLVGETAGDPDATPPVAPALKDSNGWVYLGNSGAVNPPTNGVSGKSVNHHFNGCQQTDFPQVKDLAEGYYYEFAISMTRKGTSTERNGWSGEVNFSVNVAAATSNVLFTLARGLTTAEWTKFVTNGLTNSGGASIGDPETLKIRQLFTDTQTPKFISDAPMFDAGDSFVGMDLTLDRAGTIYYVLAPVDEAEENGKIVERPVVNTTKRDAAGNVVNVPSSEIPNNGASSLKPQLVSPDRLDVFNPPKEARRILAGTINYPGAQTSITEVVKGLESEKLYYAYFVLKGASDDLSEVYVYQFRTSAVSVPIITLVTRNPKVQATTSVDARLSWMVFASNAIPTELSAAFQPVNGANVPANVKTVLDAMLNRPKEGGPTYFDLYGDPAQKEAVVQVIRVNSGSSVDLPDQGRDIAFEQNVMQLIEPQNLATPTRYYIVATARHEMSNEEADPAQIYGFAAASNLYIPDTTPPKLTEPIVSGPYVPDDPKVDPGYERFSGSFSISFSEPIYAMVWDETEQTYKKKAIKISGTAGDDEVLLKDIVAYVGMEKFEVTAARDNPQVLKFTFEKAQEGATITLFDGAYICDANSVSERMIYTFKLVVNRNGESIVGLPLAQAEFELIKTPVT